MVTTSMQCFTLSHHNMMQLGKSKKVKRGNKLILSRKISLLCLTGDKCEIVLDKNSSKNNGNSGGQRCLPTLTCKKKQ